MSVDTIFSTAHVAYEAGKNMVIAGEPRNIGELVPEADTWDATTIAKLTRTGHLRVHMKMFRAIDEGVPDEGAPSVSKAEGKGRGKKDAPK